jgi:hypothetical protein
MELIAREQCKTQVGTHKFVLTSSLQRSYFLFLQFMDGSTMILVSTSLNLNKKGSRNSISKKKSEPSRTMDYGTVLVRNRSELPEPSSAIS